MTDKELNELIAIKRGWIYKPYEKLGSMYEPEVLWYNSKTNASFYSAAPDFCGSWRWAGELLEEMAKKEDIKIMECGSFSSVTGPDYKFQIESNNNYATAKTLTRSISEVWYEINHE